MTISLRPVQSAHERKQFATFPWQIYQGDRFWVPPLIEDRLYKLDPQRNPFWKTADQYLWMAWLDDQPAGTIAAIIDHHGNEVLGEKVGTFGFFECIQDREVARNLLDSAADWLAKKGCSKMRGPYSPTQTDESGILVEGFNTRPAILMGHNPPYYPSFFEENGFIKFDDLLARIWRRKAEYTRIEDGLPEKLLRVAEIAAKRPDVIIRNIRMKDWDAEIRLACEIYNLALGDLPDYIPIPLEEFRAFAESFKPLINPRFALVIEVGGRPVGFALALPDVNEALQHVNGRLDWLGLAKLWWYSRRLSRICFKILMILPDYHNRGIEAVLGMKMAHEIWDAGYREVDLSLTGETNIRSSLFQQNIGAEVYRRYRIYEKRL